MAVSDESTYLGYAKTQYVKGSLDLDEYEKAVAHVLRGGTLTPAGHIPAKIEIHKNESQFPRPLMDQRVAD